jgi:hypothetical protein
MKLLLIFTFFINLSASLIPGAETQEYKTKSGMTITIRETHPRGHSLSTIEIKSIGFEHNINETIVDEDPIKDVFVTDLDGNGFDEIYVITISAGSGSYGKVIGFASNKDKSLSMVYFPEIHTGDENFVGYMGHDVFSIENKKLIRIFPIYWQKDSNDKPTGGVRKLIYGLKQGEASWHLQVESPINAE